MARPALGAAFRCSLSGLFAIVFVASAVMYFRSLRHFDSYGWGTADGAAVGVQSSHGELLVYCNKTSASQHLHIPSEFIGFQTGPPLTFNSRPLDTHYKDLAIWMPKPRPPQYLRESFGFLGVRLLTGELRVPNEPIPVSAHEFVVPYTWLMAVTLIYPAFAFGRHLRHRRDNPHQASTCCGKCGYDLRASVDRCPECGTGIRSLN